MLTSMTGQFVSAGVLQSYEGRPGQWSYRIPFALQWMWPAPLFAAALFMPESPWWLARAGKYDSAEQTLLRLSSGMQQEEARKQVAMMVHTNEIEKELVAGSSYLDCFGEFCGEYVCARRCTNSYVVRTHLFRRIYVTPY